MIDDTSCIHQLLLLSITLLNLLSVKLKQSSLSKQKQMYTEYKYQVSSRCKKNPAKVIYILSRGTQICPVVNAGDQSKSPSSIQIFKIRSGTLLVCLTVLQCLNTKAHIRVNSRWLSRPKNSLPKSFPLEDNNSSTGICKWRSTKATAPCKPWRTQKSAMLHAPAKSTDLEKSDDAVEEANVALGPTGTFHPLGLGPLARAPVGREADLAQGL